MGGTFALATTVAERVLDTGFLVIVGGLSLLGHPLVPEWLSRGLIVLAVISCVGLAVLLAMPRIWDPLATRLERIPRLSSTVRRLRERWLDRFFEGLASIRHPGRMAMFLALTCALWFFDAVGVVLVARALGVVLSIPAALVLLSALGASSAVPLTPGQIGVYQWVASSVLGSYGVAPEPAVLIAIGLQAMNYLVAPEPGGRRACSNWVGQRSSACWPGCRRGALRSRSARRARASERLADRPRGCDRVADQAMDSLSCLTRGRGGRTSSRRLG